MSDQPADGIRANARCRRRSAADNPGAPARSSQHQCLASAPTASPSIPRASDGRAPRATDRRPARPRGRYRRCHPHCHRPPRRPSIGRHNPAGAASRCCHRCSRPRCAPARSPPRAAMRPALPAPNRRVRHSAKRPRGRKADRARPPRQSRQPLPRALKASASRFKSRPAQAIPPGSPKTTQHIQ